MSESVAAEGGSPLSRGAWLVDGHVHVHPGVVPADLLDSASANFATAAAAAGLPPTTPGVLLLTESEGIDFFGEAAGMADRGGSFGPWSVLRCGDPDAVVARRDGAEPIAVVAGRQVVTRESLEVLALGTVAKFVDGRDLASAIEAVRAAGAIAAIPWGFGKWWASRGRTVRSWIERSRPGALFLGDNGGRPRATPRPPLFRLAESRGIAVLPGTDPLPLDGQSRRVGSYGFVLPGPVDPDRPATSMRRAVRDPGFRVVPFGVGERWWSFAVSQVAMQLRARRRRGTA